MSKTKSGSSRAGKWIILRFVAGFLLVLVILYAISRTSFFETTLYPAIFEWNAAASAAVLRLLGEPVTAEGNRIVTDTQSIAVWRGCDASEPWALFAAAVTAFRARVMAKLAGLVVGSVALAVLNVARIVTLWLVASRHPDSFELMHVEVWQTAFFVFVVAMWTAWALWATRPVRPVAAGT